MTAFLLDTHVWVWDLIHSERLAPAMLSLIDQSDDAMVSVISLYEIAQKVRLGKWPEMAPYAENLVALLDEQGYRLAALSSEASQLAGLMDWTHRDPFDRMIAATAISLKTPLISADPVFDQLARRPDWPGRLWRSANP